VSHDIEITMPADQALAAIKEGNRRFAEGSIKYPYINGLGAEYDHTTQRPIVTVHTCGDARVKPRLIFDQPIGGVFQTATAGHVTDFAVLGSHEYSVQHLGVRLIVIMGHSNCGAIKATLADFVDPTESHIGSLTEVIRPHLVDVKATPGDLVENAVKANVRAVVQEFLDNRFLMKGNDVGTDREIKVVGAYYDLATGKVEFLD